MYVLARHEKESIVIAGLIEIKVLSINGKTVRLGIDAPKEVSVKRLESLMDNATDSEGKGNGQE